jgi:NTP pyrophosphatase (non-canonical NTP hydrolase)
MTDHTHVLSLTLDPAFARILEQQRQIQIGHMGGDPAEMPDDKRREFIRNMSFALVAEVVEATDETSWKPWAATNQPVIKNREAFKSELADVFIFLMNLMLVGDITTSEFLTAVSVKQQINIKRQIDGYDGNNKCPRCKAAYDDPAVNCTPPVTSTGARARCDNGDVYL